MNSFKLGIATLLIASAAVSLTTAGTPNILVGSPRDLQARPAVASAVNTDQDLAHGAPFAGSPRANALAVDLKRSSGSRMDCCSTVLAKTSTLSPRAASALPGQNASPIGMKCSMGHRAVAATGCCAPAPAPRVACCG